MPCQKSRQCNPIRRINLSFRRASDSITSRAVLVFLVCQWIEVGLAAVPIAGDRAGLGG